MELMHRNLSALNVLPAEAANSQSQAISRATPTTPASRLKSPVLAWVQVSPRLSSLKSNIYQIEYLFLKPRTIPLLFYSQLLWISPRACVAGPATCRHPPPTLSSLIISGSTDIKSYGNLICGCNSSRSLSFPTYSQRAQQDNLKRRTKTNQDLLCLVVVR